MLARDGSPAVYRLATAAISRTRLPSGADSAQAMPSAIGMVAASATSVRLRIAASCASTSVSGRASRTNPTFGCRARAATYNMSVAIVSLYRWKTPIPLARASTTSGREAWLSSVVSCSGVCVESPTTRPSSAIKVTRLALYWPRRSASASSDASSNAVADEMRWATSRASSMRRLAMAIRCRSRTCQDSSRAATISETPAAPIAAMKTFVRKRVRTFARSGLRLGLVRDQLVAELLDRHESIDKHRQLLAQPAHMDVHRARAAGIAIPPHVAKQQIPRQHAAAMLQEVAQEHEFFRRQLHLFAVIGDRVRGQVDVERPERQAGFLRFVPARAAHQGPDARDQLVRAEGL